MSCITDGEIHDRPTPKRDSPLAAQCDDGISKQIKKRLDQLVAVEVHGRQTGIIIAADVYLISDFRLNQAYNVFKQLMHIRRLFVGWTTGPQQRVDQAGETIGLADNNARVFLELLAMKLLAQQLRRAANTAEGIFYFMCELANHLPPRAVLNEQGIFPADSQAAGHVQHFDQQACRQVYMLERGHPDINNAVLGMNFRGPESKFRCICLSSLQRPGKDVLKLGIVVSELQQGFTVCPVLADAEQVFGCGVQCRN